MLFYPAIIGKGGKTIQDLRLKHRCQIQMADCESPERVLIINGDQNDVLNCVSDILLNIHENHQRSTKTEFPARIPVPDVQYCFKKLITIVSASVNDI